MCNANKFYYDACMKLNYLGLFLCLLIFSMFVKMSGQSPVAVTHLHHDTTLLPSPHHHWVEWVVSPGSTILGGQGWLRQPHSLPQWSSSSERWRTCVCLCLCACVAPRPAGSVLSWMGVPYWVNSTVYPSCASSCVTSRPSWEWCVASPGEIVANYEGTRHGEK